MAAEAAGHKRPKPARAHSGGQKGIPPGALRSKPIKHRARDALGSGGLAALYGFGMPRCREATRPVGPSMALTVRSGPQASRAPSDWGGGSSAPRLIQERGIDDGPARGPDQRIRAAERWLNGVPGTLNHCPALHSRNHAYISRSITHADAWLSAPTTGSKRPSGGPSGLTLIRGGPTGEEIWRYLTFLCVSYWKLACI